MRMRDRLGSGPETDCPACVAWYAEAQRALLLLETLAEDHFPDQAAFDRWMDALLRHALKPRAGWRPDA